MSEQQAVGSVLVRLERRGWRALATDRNAARDFYADVLSADAVMILPNGMRLAGRDAILDALDVQPWRHFDLSEIRVTAIADNTFVLTYRVDAERAGHAPYRAMVSSVYVAGSLGHRLAHHQQTPI